jgi:hypothetical protein
MTDKEEETASDLLREALKPLEQFPNIYQVVAPRLMEVIRTKFELKKQ